MDARTIAAAYDDAGITAPPGVLDAVDLADTIAALTIDHVDEGATIMAIREAIATGRVTAGNVRHHLEKAALDGLVAARIKAIAADVAIAVRERATIAALGDADATIEALRPRFTDAITTIRENLQPAPPPPRDASTYDGQGGQIVRPTWLSPPSPDRDDAVDELDAIARVRLMLRDLAHGEVTAASCFVRRPADRNAAIFAEHIYAGADGSPFVALLEYGVELRLNNADEAKAAHAMKVDGVKPPRDLLDFTHA